MNKTNIKKMRWNYEFAADDITHIVCVSLENNKMTGLHTHDFVEASWVTEGQCTHIVNGVTEKLHEGDFLLMRPSDVHNLSTNRYEKCIFVNLAFIPEILDDLANKYDSPLLKKWLQKDGQPMKFTLSHSFRQWIDAAVNDLFNNKHSLLVLCRFLLNLIFELEGLENNQFRNCPEWLRNACLEVQDVKYFSLGSKALSIISGYTEEHVARTLKKYTGLTPSQLVNSARMNYAAASLATTSRSVTEIAFDCGFESLSHFFVCFKKQFKITPRQYRINNLKLMTS
jgi:AraC family cel operon transcriptional repressor